MIVQSTRISRESGVEKLEKHLLDKDDDNEVIEVISGDRAALHDAQAYANLKRCRYSLRHWSISPELDMTPGQLADFLATVDAEFRIGQDRPRLVVRHVKSGRQHFHVVVGEVDPVSSRILDCRKDYQRLEHLARAYERKYGETVQVDHRERKMDGREGLSQLGRKRAERVAPRFDRTRLKVAFVAGRSHFAAELMAQGLMLTSGRKCPILLTREGVFVAAAHRVCGAKVTGFQREFLGSENVLRPMRATSVNAKRPAPSLRSLTKRELWHLANGKVDYDELLKRALELADAIQWSLHVGAERNRRKRTTGPNADQRHSGSKGTPKWNR